MQEFEKSQTVNVAADRVFEYVSDLNNLPQYLPTLHRAENAGGDRIRVEGEAAGHKYNDTGFFRTDRGRRRMEWGSDGESGYQGWLEVKEKGGHQSCEVIVHLSFDPTDRALKEMDKRGSHEQQINQGMENTLQSIKNQCEGRGGKVEAARHR